jgi:hypothetical protein
MSVSLEVVVRVDFVERVFSLTHYSVELLLADDAITVPIGLVDHLYMFVCLFVCLYVYVDGSGMLVHDLTGLRLRRW